MRRTHAALVATSDEWWDAVTDGLADSIADVLLASLAATNKLFAAAAESGRSATALRTSARRTALRVSLVMGPLVDTWRMLPSHAQVAVASLMGHIATALIGLDPGGAGAGGAGAAAAPLGVDTSGQGGSLSAALAGVTSYLAGALHSLNPAVKLEAARVLLRMSSASECARPVGACTRGVGWACPSAQVLAGLHSLPTHRTRLAAAGRALPPLSSVRVASSVPPSVAASAIAALLELKERMLVEAALAEVISLVAGHLDVLPVGVCAAQGGQGVAARGRGGRGGVCRGRLLARVGLRAARGCVPPPTARPLPPAPPRRSPPASTCCGGCGR